MVVAGLSTFVYFAFLKPEAEVKRDLQGPVQNEFPALKAPLSDTTKPEEKTNSFTPQNIKEEKAITDTKQSSHSPEEAQMASPAPDGKGPVLVEEQPVNVVEIKKDTVANSPDEIVEPAGKQENIFERKVKAKIDTSYKLFKKKN